MQAAPDSALRDGLAQGVRQNPGHGGLPLHQLDRSFERVHAAENNANAFERQTQKRLDRITAIAVESGMNFGDRRKQVREKKNLTQDQLAKMAGVRQSTISSIEERSSKNSKHAPALAAALGVSLDWALTGPDDSAPKGKAGSDLVIREPGVEYVVDSRSYTIPQYSVSASMGDGAFVDEHVDVVRGLQVNVEELRKQATFTSPRNLEFITGYGNSMPRAGFLLPTVRRP